MRSGRSLSTTPGQFPASDSKQEWRKARTAESKVCPPAPMVRVTDPRPQKIARTMTTAGWAVNAGQPPAGAVLRDCCLWSSMSVDGFATSHLVVCFRHLHPMCSLYACKCRNQKTTSHIRVLVDLLNLTFEMRTRGTRDSNVKFDPLGFVLPRSVGSERAS